MDAEDNGVPLDERIEKRLIRNEAGGLSQNVPIHGKIDSSSEGETV